MWELKRRLFGESGMLTLLSDGYKTNYFNARCESYLHPCIIAGRTLLGVVRQGKDGSMSSDTSLI